MTEWEVWLAALIGLVALICMYTLSPAFYWVLIVLMLICSIRVVVGGLIQRRKAQKKDKH
ncbi:hypothetical protein [Seinonella peptonophila]|uniref:hypothetical protein n=1 Tax=Seinonella peptonophila TaxID=112248 RepID=UPI001114E52F|nr:hypothetical protein [Seinonella peptonophila]